jgi:hypothetical protein
MSNKLITSMSIVFYPVRWGWDAKSMWEAESKCVCMCVCVCVCVIDCSTKNDMLHINSTSWDIIQFISIMMLFWGMEV